MYSEAKTETLSDVLRELAELAPDKFAPSVAGFSYGSNSAEEWITITGQDDWRDNSRIQAACQEECREYLWSWRIENDPYSFSPEKHFTAMIWDDTLDNPLGACYRAGSPALAIATALLGALKAGAK